MADMTGEDGEETTEAEGNANAPGSFITLGLPILYHRIMRLSHHLKARRVNLTVSPNQKASSRKCLAGTGYRQAAAIS
jgi:precorrin-2 methylase